MDAKTTCFRTGMIMLWSGPIASIPGGWALCDGYDGTPDLTNRFIVGAGQLYAVDDVGGVLWHGHSITNSSHNHNLDDGDRVAAGDEYAKATDNTTATTGTETTISLPPYYALAYIIKL